MPNESLFEKECNDSYGSDFEVRPTFKPSRKCGKRMWAQKKKSQKKKFFGFEYKTRSGKTIAIRFLVTNCVIVQEDAM